MEIKIVINKHNKDKLLQLIDQLVECEAQGISAESTGATTFEKDSTSTSSGFLREIPKFEEFEVAEPKIRSSRFGTWGMFNSYVPGKAALRVLSNLIDEKGGKPVIFSELLSECISYFARSGLGKYRGFPKKTSESAQQRLAIHLVLPYEDMGLIRTQGNKKDPSVVLTKEGIEFTTLRNPLLDDGDKKKSLSEKESLWMRKHLRKIDQLGFKEFSVFVDLANFLSGKEKRYHEIVSWFKSNQSFVDWLKTGSRHRDDPKAFSRQLENVARTFATGKIALLRELGVVSTARATYRVLQNLEDQ